MENEMTDRKNTSIPRDQKQPHPKPNTNKGLPPVEHTPKIPPVKPPKK